MSRSIHKVGTAFRMYFGLFDGADDPVTSGSFSYVVLKDGVADSSISGFTHVSSGIWTVTFTPASTGTWCLYFRETTYNKRGWMHTLDVTTGGPPNTDSSGQVTVGSIASGAITAAAIASDAITAAKVASDVTTEFQSGLATSAALTALSDDVADLPTAAEVATAVGALEKDGHTLLEHQGVQSAMLAGKASGGPGSAGGLTFRAIDDSAVRVVMTATSSGDRDPVAITP